MQTGGRFAFLVGNRESDLHLVNHIIKSQLIERKKKILADSEEIFLFDLKPKCP